MTKLPKKVKMPSTAKLKKKLDKIFSQFIRQKYANKEGYVQCYTCGRSFVIKSIQCGHFVSRAYLATRFNEDNCRPQCVGCNVFGKGRVAAFATKLEKELGEGTISRLYKDSQRIVKDYPYQEKIEHYQNLIKTL